MSNESETPNFSDIRADFLELTQIINGKPLVYLDNAASTLKPEKVVERIKRHYQYEATNIHRGVHTLSETATRDYELARQSVQKFIGAKHDHEIIVTSGTTESINLVANCFGSMALNKDSEIIISHMEHHSNIVPWQMIANKTGATLKVIPINENGELIMEEFDKLLSSKTKIVSVVYISNSLGTINPIKEIITKSHQVGAKVLVDGAQAVAHKSVNVQELDCDFFAFSGHKIFGPTGIGILYGKEEILHEMPPYQGGGDMIDKVTFEKTTYAALPSKFEAGTPHIAGLIGLGEAIEYVSNIGLSHIEKYEHELLSYAHKKLSEIKQLKMIGTAKEKASVCAFLLEGVHPVDFGTLADKDGVAVRTGHHCTQPVMQHFNIEGTIRASLSIYNNKHDVDMLVQSIHKSLEFFS